MESYNSQPCLYYTPDHLDPISVLYIDVYAIDKTWSKHEPDQTTDYAVNPMSKIVVQNSCIKIVAYTEQQQTTGCSITE